MAPPWLNTDRLAQRYATTHGIRFPCICKPASMYLHPVGNRKQHVGRMRFRGNAESGYEAVCRVTGKPVRLSGTLESDIALTRRGQRVAVIARWHGDPEVFPLPPWALDAKRNLYALAEGPGGERYWLCHRYPLIQRLYAVDLHGNLVAWMNAPRIHLRDDVSPGDVPWLIAMLWFVGNIKSVESS